MQHFKISPAGCMSCSSILSLLQGRRQVAHQPAALRQRSWACQHRLQVLGPQPLCALLQAALSYTRCYMEGTACGSLAALHKCIKLANARRESLLPSSSACQHRRQVLWPQPLCTLLQPRICFSAG